MLLVDGPRRVAGETADDRDAIGTLVPSVPGAPSLVITGGDLSAVDPAKRRRAGVPIADPEASRIGMGTTRPGQFLSSRQAYENAQ